MTSATTHSRILVCHHVRWIDEDPDSSKMAKHSVVVLHITIHTKQYFKNVSKYWINTHCTIRVTTRPTHKTNKYVRNDDCELSLTKKVLKLRFCNLWKNACTLWDGVSRAHTHSIVSAERFPFVLCSVKSELFSLGYYHLVGQENAERCSRRRMEWWDGKIIVDTHWWELIYKIIIVLFTRSLLFFVRGVQSYFRFN